MRNTVYPQTPGSHICGEKDTVGLLVLTEALYLKLHISSSRKRLRGRGRLRKHGAREDAAPQIGVV